MADDKDPLKKLKDLSKLKLQWHVDNSNSNSNEVTVKIPQGGFPLGSPFLKGFMAGYLVAKIRSSAILGVLFGTVTGIYAAQNYEVPNIEMTVKDYLNNVKKGPK